MNIRPFIEHLTWGEYCKLSPEGQKRWAKLYLRRCGLIEDAKLQADEQADHDWHLYCDEWTMKED